MSNLIFLGELIASNLFGWTLFEVFLGKQSDSSYSESTSNNMGLIELVWVVNLSGDQRLDTKGLLTWLNLSWSSTGSALI